MAQYRGKNRKRYFGRRKEEGRFVRASRTKKGFRYPTSGRKDRIHRSLADDNYEERRSLEQAMEDLEDMTD